MPKRTPLAPHLTLDQLERRYRICEDAREKIRWQALWLYAKNLKIPVIKGVPDTATRRSTTWYGATTSKAPKRFRTAAAPTHPHVSEPSSTPSSNKP